MPRDKSLRPIAITRMKNSVAEACDDTVAAEEPLEIRVAGKSIAIVMRTPGHDRELAAGFLVTEGIVRERDEVLDMIYCGSVEAKGGEKITGETRVPENILDVILAPRAKVDLARLTRHVFTSSSCGVCSKATIDAVRLQFPRLAQPFSPRCDVLAALPAKLQAVQAGFTATGGLHASALFDAAGNLVVVREDVGRHNALDKVIGHAFFGDQLPFANHILLVSGRVSFEIVQKALAAGISCIAAISAPTSAAVELARETGQTLVGFLRGERMNVYAGTLAE